MHFLKLSKSVKIYFRSDTFEKLLTVFIESLYILQEI